jgi:hypothetical protein
MEITIGMILLLIVLVKVAKPNFFNFGTVINNYNEKEVEQIAENKKKRLKGRRNCQ